MEVKKNLLLRIEADLGRLGLAPAVIDALIGLIRTNADLPPAAEAPRPGHAEIARSFYRSSLLRTEALGGRIVADGAWNMLLDLFAAGEEAGHISISSACIASGGPPSTALRQLGWMEQSGLVRRVQDPRDGRRSWIELKPETQQLMRQLIDNFCAPMTNRRPSAAPPI